MITVNEYFDGNVKSLAYNSAEGKSTIGVIEKGEYEFGTTEHETMTIIEGSLNTLLPGESTWKLIPVGGQFDISAGQTFKVRAASQTSYLCKYR